MEFHKNGRGHLVRVGDEVEYATFGGGIRVVTITDVLEDVKNGYPGFDGIILGGGAQIRDEAGDRAIKETVWGYTDQIRKVNGEEV